MHFSEEDMKELKKIWQSHSRAFKYFKRCDDNEKVCDDEIASQEFLHTMRKMKAAGVNAEELWNIMTEEPLRRNGETRRSHSRTIALRQLIIDFLDVYIGQESHELREATIMKNIWDRLFDRLSANNFRVSATEETMKASKNRRLKQSINYVARGKMSDKSWKTNIGIEIAWQEAAKADAVKDPHKFSTDKLKILKGVKDMIDFATERTGHDLEMFGIVTSGSDAKIFSMVRIPSGIYLAKVLTEISIPQSFASFQYLLNALDTTLKWLKAMDEIAKILEVPLSRPLDDSDEERDSFPTMRTP